MGFILMKPKSYVKKRKRSTNGKEVLARLDAFLQESQREPVEILCGFWEDQQSAITYQELRLAVKEGYLDEKYFDEWSQDYSNLVKNRMQTIWNDAMIAGSVSQPIMDPVADYFVFNTQTPGILEWIKNRGAALVTNSSEIQRGAIEYLLADKIREQYTVDELAKLIRPCIGLTVSQTSTAKKFYDNALASIKTDHPRMKEEAARKKAIDRTAKYAERMHRQRAVTIAQTELAKAYNYGSDQGIRQAQADYLIGKCIKRWNTSGDSNVCDTCNDLDGTEVGFEETFFSGNKVDYDEGLFPPAHPRCACAIEYVEVEPPDKYAMEEEQSRKHPDDPEYQETEAAMDVIDSNEYSKRFMALGEEMDTVRAVRNTARDFVKHRSGTKGEDLAFIASETGTTKVNKKGVTEQACSPTKEMMKMLENAKPYTIIGLHNHPESMPPSIDDIIVAVQRKYKYGIVAGHDGTIYRYTITKRSIELSDLNLPEISAALNKMAREKGKAITAGIALTKLSDETYNSFKDTFVMVEVL